MTKAEALKLIDDHKNKLLNPVEMLDWVWLRLLILKIPEADWDRMMNDVAEEMK